MITNNNFSFLSRNPLTSVESILKLQYIQNVFLEMVYDGRLCFLFSHNGFMYYCYCDNTITCWDCGKLVYENANFTYNFKNLTITHLNLGFTEIINLNEIVLN